MPVPAVPTPNEQPTPMQPLQALHQELTEELGLFEVEVVDLDQNGETFPTLLEAITYLEKEMLRHGSDAAGQSIRAISFDEDLEEPVELTFDWKVTNLRRDE